MFEIFGPKAKKCRLRVVSTGMIYKTVEEIKDGCYYEYN